MRFFILAILLLAGCGYTSKDNELVGQVKKVKHQTPIICPNYSVVDISLGVMRNGVGSMSGEDVWALVEDKDHLRLLTDAAEKGQLVKVKYGVRRFTICVPEFQINSVEVMK